MMDGPWQEVIYNLSLPCVSVRQLRQTERERERHTETETGGCPPKRMTGKNKQKKRRSRFFIYSQLCCSMTAQVKAATDTLHF